MELMRKAVAGSVKKELPRFDIGDTVDVSVRIIEGEKERVQVFTGVVLGRKGSGIGQTFTVRRIVAGEGVERIFPIHSPRILAVTVVRKAHTRRAKLYYLRERTGKATSLRGRNVSEQEGHGSAAAAPAGAKA
jgi:large subunit ribosomal protein L19